MELYHSDCKAPNQQNKLNIYHVYSDNKIYLLIDNDSNDTHLLFEIKQPSEFEKDLFRFASMNYIHLILISFDKAQKSTQPFTFTITVNFNIFLSDVLKSNLTAENPTNSFQWNSGYEPLKMHNLLNKFSLTNNVFIDSLDNFDDESTIDRENQTSNCDDDRNENLFDLVHRVHQEEYRNERYDDPEHRDVGLIKSHAALRPTLRGYQINAIRWMLKMENFNIESATSQSQQNSESHMLGTNKCMVKLEKQIPQETEEENNLHPLFEKLVDKDLNVIYFHKYFAL